jgi:hypothetical protein
MFCQRAQIPYQVLAFSTQYGFTDEQMSAANAARRALHQSEENLIDNYAGMFSLLELFSSKMSNVEFNTMVRRTTSWHFKRCDQRQFDTGGTPLNEALMYMLNVHMGKFIKNNSVEKMTLITLSDGEGGSLNSNKGNFRNKFTEYTNTGGYRYVNVKHFIRDTITKKNYNINDNSATHTAALLKMIKDRFSINVLGFYICENHRNTLRGALQNNIPEFNGDVYATIDSMRKEFRDVGYASLKNTGRDELFIIPVASTKIEEGEMSANADMSAAAIAKKFSKFMNNKKTSRVLLNNFIGYVARTKYSQGLANPYKL